MKKDYGKNMSLFTSAWGNEKTVKMLPVTLECPFTEVIYDPATTLLVVISKVSKQNFQMVPKLDENGELTRSTKVRANGKSYKEHRVVIDILQEYYIENHDEQIEFIKTFAVNAATFDYQSIVRDMSKESTIHKVGTLPLVDKSGQVLK